MIQGEYYRIYQMLSAVTNRKQLSSASSHIRFGGIR